MQTNGSGRATGHVFVKTAKSGARSWYAKYRTPDGRQVQKRLGPAHVGKGRPKAGVLTKGHAEDQLRRILIAADDGQLQGRFAPSSGHTFRQAADAWLAWLKEKGRKPSTLSDYESVVDSHLLPAIGADTALAKIDPASIERLRTGLLAGKRVVRDGDQGRRAAASPAGWRRTCQKVLMILRAILNRAVRRGWLTVNPMAGIEPVDVAKAADFNVLSREQVEAVARAADSPMAAALIRVAAYAGLRWGELRALQWGDVDFTQASIKVSRSYDDRAKEDGTPKSGKVRVVPLSDQAAAALDSLSRRDHFTGPGDRVFASVTGDVLLEEWGRKRALFPALDAAGLGHLRERAPGRHPFRFHDLRHTFGSLAAAAGVSVVAIQSMMGHGDLATTQRYMHHAPRHDDAALLTRAFGGPVDVAADDVPSGVPNRPVSTGTERN